jgi:hypothetical protein
MDSVVDASMYRWDARQFDANGPIRQRSIDALYQEAGRAGRGQNKANCIVFYRPQDVSRLAAPRNHLDMISVEKRMSCFFFLLLVPIVHEGLILSISSGCGAILSGLFTMPPFSFRNVCTLCTVGHMRYTNVTSEDTLCTPH